MNLVFAALLCVMVSTSPSSEVRQCRELYFSEQSEKQIASLEKASKSIPADKALQKAYLGVSLSMKASYAFSPFSKFSIFKDGTDLIEEAVDLSPENAEIRVLRLGVQLNAPGFLMYSGNKKDDIELIITSLENGAFTEDATFRANVISYLITQADLSEAQQLRLSPLEND
ncbi:MAG: hypothetical protein P8H59_09110 [Flavobacteriales bacterium]|nr:hypothetical protein [Flavobacteriales bacterium]MDG1781098.1 hypothetical protein [Flavobacteriales bacterium]MDG2246527.1 hypothetical protein [Flavobacteriales bacterium]